LPVCHQVQKCIHRRLRPFQAQFLIVALERLLDEPVDRLAGASGKIMGQVARLCAANGELRFGHGYLASFCPQYRPVRLRWQGIAVRWLRFDKGYLSGVSDPELIYVQYRTVSDI